MNNTFILFCDSSKNSFGASLLCVVGDELWPICAVSKSHARNAQKYCINRKELLSIVHSSNDLHLLLQNRPHFVATDSSFAKHCLTKPIEEIGSKIRSAVLLYRERFFSRVLKIPGNLNSISDICSRYVIPSAASSGITSEHDTKIIKWHMDKTKIDESVRQSIEQQNIDLLNPNHITVEDEMTKQAHDFLPECYTLDSASGDDDCCTGDDFCCTFQGGSHSERSVNTFAETDTPITNLKTIHKVSKHLTDELRSKLTDAQLSQLSDADYVILESNSSPALPPIQTVPASEMAQRGIQELAVGGLPTVTVDRNEVRQAAPVPPIDDRIDEEISSVAVIHRPGDEPDEIGINKFEVQSDGSVEIMRSFDYLPVDNIAYLAAALQQHVKDDNAMSDEGDGVDDMSDSDSKPGYVPSDSGGMVSGVSENSSDSGSPLNVVSDLGGITFGWFDDLGDFGPLARPSHTKSPFPKSPFPLQNPPSQNPLSENSILPLFGTRARKRAKPVSTDDGTDGTQKVSDCNEANISQRQRVVNEQQADPDTRTIIECVELGKQPEYHEIRQESPYLNAVMDEFGTL